MSGTAAKGLSLLAIAGKLNALSIETSPWAKRPCAPTRHIRKLWPSVAGFATVEEVRKAVEATGRRVDFVVDAESGEGL